MIPDYRLPVTTMMTAMSKPLPDLPADVWLYIFQIFKDDYDRVSVLSLASVNKFLRGVGLSVLFLSLFLSAPSKTVELRTLSYLKKAIQRVRGINASPHILNAIRRLNLFYWYICPCENPDDNDVDIKSGSTIDSDCNPVSFRAKLHELKLDGYREIIALISHLPRLDYLACHYCSFTSESFSRISGMPNVKSLHVHCHTMIRDDSTKCQVAVTNSSLCVFQYTLRYWPEVNIVELIIPLIGQLVVSSFPFNILADILADNNLPITLPKLQKLSLCNFRIGAEDNQDDLICIRNFLSLTPNLRELYIIGNIHTKTPFIIPDTAIPRLKTLIAPLCIANCIAPGRALGGLRVLAFQRNFRESYTVVSRDIEHVVYSGELKNPEEDLSHLAQVFPEASTVEIIVEGACRRKEFSDVVLSIIPEFRHLKRCTVYLDNRYPPDYNCPPPYCPAGCVDDPKYRSHPTLEELQILSFHRWIWCPKDGWHSVRTSCTPDELDLTPFFD